jgi:uncharacterized protein (DUF302 family)
MKVSRIFRTVCGGVCVGLLLAVGVLGQSPTKGNSKRMRVHEIQVERFSVVSSRSFDEVVASLNQKIGHPDMVAFRTSISEAQTESALEVTVQRAVGPSGLMEFAHFDLGEVLRKESGAATPRSLRLVLGNPLIMKQMVKFAPDAGSYAPVTILIDERPDGVHLSYDRMASFLASYGSSEALRVARDLDSKVEGLLTAAAG